MNDNQRKAIKLLWDFWSLREEHIRKLCGCSEGDINCLISSKAIIKDTKTNILTYTGKDLNSRNIVAFDVVMEYLDRNPIVKKSKNYPIAVSMQTNFFSYDIIAVTEAEMENLAERIDTISKSERVIIIIETKQYKKRKIQTQRPVMICTYSPLELVERIN